jgi:ribosome-binding ATPase YchF (GTP1/OBG family)
MKDVGLVGLPSAGKSTLFTALTRVGAAGGRANQAVVEVPDPRLPVLAEMERSKRIVHAQLRFSDVPGGLSGPAVAAMREADALGIVLDAFTGTRDPAADLAEVRSELLLADLALAESSAERAERRAKGHDAEAQADLGRLARARELLEAERPLREGDFDETDRKAMRGFGFLSLKPWVVVANLEEGAALPPGLPEDAVGVYASIEAEVAAMEPAEAGELLAEFGVEEPGLSRVISACYGALDLITFLTTGEDETRAWQVRRGALAPEAAGVIHTDLERGFIRAEVVSYDDLVAAGSMKAAKDGGVVRTEGKTYQVREGDVVNILFSV